MVNEEPVLGRQALKSKLTREKIIKAVVSLIKEGGFSAASTSRIAERAGMTWGAAQHHFGSKEEILDAVMTLSHEKFTELMEDKSLRQGSVADRADQFVDRMWLHYQDDLYLAALEILLETRGSPERASEPSIFEARSRGHLKTLREIFPESKLTDDQMIDALIFVHCFLTGLSIERLFENQIRHVDVHIRRIKVSLLSLLSFA
jgi:AcrR family transcriptional regulator